MARCRGCGREIRWAVSEAGKKMPFDIEPDPEEGTFFLIAHPQGSPSPLAIHRSKVDAFPEECDSIFYLPHHATCPDADRFRR